MYEEEHHSLESFSLVSGVTIRDIAQLEAKILILIDFQAMIKEEDIFRLKTGKVDELFQSRPGDVSKEQ
jgi:hypothetical protein